MTEAEWMEAEDWRTAMRFVDGRSSPRKLQLFALAVARWAIDRGAEPELSAAVDVSERFVDGAASDEELDRKHNELSHAGYSMMYADQDINAAIEITHGGDLVEAKLYIVECLEDHSPPKAAYLHCIFGNPFRPVAFAPAWLTSTAVGIARGIYDDRAFDRLPILADALQDAGCEDAEVLAHCRGDGPHVRGCWVVDGVLGKG